MRKPDFKAETERRIRRMHTKIRSEGKLGPEKGNETKRKAAEKISPKGGRDRDRAFG
jgi:hypothetical protein